MLRSFARTLGCAGALTTIGAAAVPAQSLPANGIAVLARMHDAYAGKWFKTLIFWQTTTMYRNSPTPVVQKWYESLRYTPGTGSELRIDTGEPSEGNGILYTSDSSWSMRTGKLTGASANGNPFLPMIEGVYMQPVALTARQFAAIGVDTAKVTSGTWQGSPVWIMGTDSPSDTTSPQVWVDPSRLVVVRALLSFAPNRPPYDIHLDNYAPVGKGWLATKVSMFINGKPRQIEEYHDWKGGVKLDPALFVPATWSTAKHWHT